MFTWGVMALIVVFSWSVTRHLTDSADMSRQQNLLEILVGGLLVQIREATRQEPERFLPFLGTLFIFILVSNLLSLVPGFQPPTGSLSTTTPWRLSCSCQCPITEFGSMAWQLSAGIFAALAVHAALQRHG